MDAAAALADLGDYLELSPLEFDQDGCCGLRFEDGSSVLIETVPEEAAVFLSAPLGPIPLQNTDGWLLVLLGAQNYGYDTEGHVFGYDPDQQQLFLFRRIESPLAEAQLIQSLESIQTVRGYWQEQLGRTDLAETAGESRNEVGKNIIRG